MAYSSFQVSTSEGEDLLLKKGTPKDSQGLDPIKASPFVVPTTTRKEAPTGNAPMGAIPLKAVTNRFPQVGGNRTSEAPGVVFDPSQGDEGVETPPPNENVKSLGFYSRLFLVPKPHQFRGQ